MDLDNLIQEFHSFGDGLLLSLQFDWHSDNNGELFQFTVQARNTKQEYKNICFSVSKVQHFKLSHDRNRLNYQVLSNGLHFVKFEDLWTIEFGTFSDPMPSLADVMDSDFYITGKEIQFKIIEI